MVNLEQLADVSGRSSRRHRRPSAVPHRLNSACRRLVRIGTVAVKAVIADAMLGALCGALYGMFYGRFAALMHRGQWRVVTFAGFYLLGGFAIGALVGILCKVFDVKKSLSATNMSSDTERHHRPR